MLPLRHGFRIDLAAQRRTLRLNLLAILHQLRRLGEAGILLKHLSSLPQIALQRGGFTQTLLLLPTQLLQLFFGLLDDGIGHTGSVMTV